MKYQEHYTVVCPKCAAPIGTACHEASTFARTGEKKWSLPHLARKKLAAAQPRMFAGHVVTSADSNA